MPRAADPILCYVTERISLGERAVAAAPALGGSSSSADLLVERIREAALAGVEWIQLREKDPSARALAELAIHAVAAVSQTSLSGDLLPTNDARLKEKGLAGSHAGPRIIVNDRLDVAFAAGAAGVHLGRESLPVAAVAAQSRVAALRHPSQQDSFVIGASCHYLEEAVHAERAGADYVFFGPVFATPSKAVFGPPRSIQRLAEVCSHLCIPVLAIGGITEHNARDCLAAGAAGIAAIRLFQQATDLRALVVRLRRSFGARG